MFCASVKTDDTIQMWLSLAEEADLWTSDVSLDLCYSSLSLLSSHMFDRSCWFNFDKIEINIICDSDDGHWLYKSDDMVIWKNIYGHSTHNQWYSNLNEEKKLGSDLDMDMVKHMVSKNYIFQEMNEFSSNFMVLTLTHTLHGLQVHEVYILIGSDFLTIISTLEFEKKNLPTKMAPGLLKDF